ncbi:MAG TPA: adenylyltransferase/cytidyltransferase family protein [Nitrososphaerales archaeon]|nr:adenylyltransferase/cytidyltransferase family protein [Nitrososphaerales archaeon]
MDSKHTLAAIFSMGLTGENADARALSGRLGLRLEEARRELKDLERAGAVEIRKGSAKLTPLGRRSIRVVFIGGGFELIHYGHVYTISKAKALGDALVVSVARDSTIRRRKKREPLIGEEDRVRLLSSLREVDAAILGVEGDIYVTLERVKPDVVALGYDQYHMEDDVKREAVRRKMKLKVVRLDSPYPSIKTTRILNEL